MKLLPSVALSSSLQSPQRPARQPYAAPKVEPVGAWSGVTRVIGVSVALGSLPQIGSLFQSTGD